MSESAAPIENGAIEQGPSAAVPVQFATFYVNGLLFGIDVMQVQEIIRYQEMTPVPHASPMIEGLINLRGQIITAIDLRRRLGMPPRENGRLPMNVVVRSDEEVVSLLVDEIGDVLEVSQSQFETTPETLEEGSRELVEGVYKLEGKLLLALNCSKTIDLKAS